MRLKNFSVAKRLGVGLGAFGLAAAAFAATPASAASSLSKSDWKQIAVGVYQRTDEYGTVYRQAFGVGGAQYEINLLRAELWNAKLSDSSKEYVRNLQATIAGIQAFIDNPGGPSTESQVSVDNPPNTFCGYAAHQNMDAWLVPNPGDGPGGSTSSIEYLREYAGTSVPAANFAVSASITPAGNPTTTVNGSASTTNAASPGAASLVTATTGNRGIAFTASYSTTSSVSVPGCTGGFQSFNKTGSL